MIKDEELPALRARIRKILAEDIGLAGVKEDEDKDLVFKFESLTYLVLFSESDVSFLRLMLPNFWTLEDEPEQRKAYAACMEVATQCKSIKIFSTRKQDDRQETLSATIEFLVTDIATLDDTLLMRYLSMIKNGVGEFAKRMQA